MKKILVAPAMFVAAAAVSEPLPLEHVLVSVPLHKKTAETALPVTVLSGDDLRRAATSTLGDTLGTSPGLANASFGPGVGQPVIRGQQGPRVTVLQNGTSSADASSLSADHANSVEPMLAQSVEVLRGPATLLYGGGAIGGVVNILDNRIPTSVPEALGGGIEYRYESATDMHVRVATLTGGRGQWAFHVDGLWREWRDLEIPGSAVREPDADEEPVTGRIPNTQGETSNFTLGTSFHFDSGFAGLAVSRLENEYGIPAGAHEHEEHEEDHDEEHGEDEHEGEEHEEEEGGIVLDVEQTRYDAALHLHEPLPGLEVLRGFLTYTDYEHVEIEPSGETGTLFENETVEGRLELVHQAFGPFHGVLGMQARRGRFSALGEEAFVPKTRSQEVGIFLVEDYHSDAWTYEAGLRLDWVERKPQAAGASSEDFPAFSVSGSALYQVNDAWQLGLALSRAERAPATEELFSNVEASGPEDWVVHAATNAIELGSVALDTEVSTNVDLSVLWQAGDNFVDLKLFYNDFSDYIALQNTGVEVDETFVYQYTQTDARFRGLEFDSEFLVAEPRSSQLTVGVFGDVIDSRLDGGDSVPRLPPARVGVRLALADDGWRVWSHLLRADRQDEPGLNEEETKGYFRWDMGGEYRFDMGDSDLLLSVQLKNLTDEEIRLSTSFLRDVAPESGRSVVGTLRFTF